jgi:hypothetical protein
MHARRTTNHPVVRTYLSTERRFSDGFLGRTFSGFACSKLPKLPENASFFGPRIPTPNLFPS